jgi:hypothetical protein
MSVYCACGAQWHGRYLVSAAATIEAHAKRCGAPLSHDDYRARFRCACVACSEERRRAFHAKYPHWNEQHAKGRRRR